MAKTLQLRRGTTAQNDAFTGAVGELSVDTTKKTLRLHDGTTAGGKEIIGKADIATVVATVALPLSGGTMEGDINLSEGCGINLVAQDASDTYASFGAYGSSTYLTTTSDTAKGGNLLLAKTNYPGISLRGGFQLQAWELMGADGSQKNHKLWYDALEKNLKWDEAVLLSADGTTSASKWYQKFSNGFIVQGGTITPTKLSGSKGISFSTPFSTVNYQFLVSLTSTVSQTLPSGYVEGLSADAEESYMEIQWNCTSLSVKFHWLAFGF